MNDQEPSRIFICGTGRSGTWVLYRSLEAHADIYTLPREMRFIIDPHGIMDLLDSLTVRYAPVKAREALFKFEELMRIHLVNPVKKPYYGFDFANWLGGEYYWNRLDAFCEEVVHSEFTGRTWQVDVPNEGRLVEWAKRLDIFQSRLRGKESSVKARLERARLKTAKYFHDRRQLVQMAARFVDDLFMQAAREHGKRTWCEKTPQHMLHLDFMTELFPEAAYIHIKRDPRGVALSLTKQPWAPDSLQDSCLLLRDVYERWFDLRANLNLSSFKYMEVKLEDLAHAPHVYLEQISSMCGVPNQFPGIPEIQIEKVDYWRRTMSAEELQLANRLLGPSIEKMGYKI